MEHFDLLNSLVFPFVNFAIFAFILFFVARKPLGALARKRHDEYEALQKAALKAKEEAERELAQLNERMRGLSKELQQIKALAAEEAKAESLELHARGAQLAAHLKAEAQKLASGEVLRAKEILSEEVLKLVRKEVAGKISREFGDADQTAFLHKSAEALKHLHRGA